LIAFVREFGERCGGNAKGQSGKNLSDRSQ
jgi:hypothetical protein